MRVDLAPYLGRRRSFTARFVRYGTRKAYKGPDLVTLLFEDVRTGGDIVTGHLWFTMCQAWRQLGLTPGIGEVVQFTATVSTYEKGYKGRRDLDDAPPIATDYCLKRPGNIMRAELVAGGTATQPLLL